MGFQVTSLWSSPELNPVNRKARSIPVLNPINHYGRVFFFAWWGFMIAFWSWYAFPPLMSRTIKRDLKLSQIEIANSNIIGLTATLLVRIVAGPSCDRFGPRNTFAACLLLGSIPTFLAGTVNSATGLMILRFFVGILGGSFVPCQVWSTGFFDKNVVGTANSLTAGWGNAGGGITYFVMPAIFDSLVKNQHLTPHVAWRVSFVVPGILIVATALLMLILCPDTPTGKWSERHMVLQQLQTAPPTPGISTFEKSGGTVGANTPVIQRGGEESKFDKKDSLDFSAIETACGEVVVVPTFKEAASVTFSLQTFAAAASYFTTFGAELAINSILGSYYLKNFPFLGQSGSGNWAAMFGLINIVSRPFGGIMSDFLYRGLSSPSSPNRGVWAKKSWLTFLTLITGVFQLAIGLKDSHTKSTTMGLVAGMALFLEASNGANFSLVPHVHPYANGIVSGIAGAMGNLGGIVFAIVFRYTGVDYARVIWIIGCVTLGINLCLAWIPPVPRGQVGGR